MNIGWHVGERRADGYHDVNGLLHTISLADRLEITVGGDGEIPARVVVPGHPSLENGTNLVCAAAAVLARATGVELQPTTVVVHKSIPVTAGLGGGSADAAAALIGLNTVWGVGRTARQLIAMGAEIGSDVPGILLGGLVHVSGRGEVVRRAGAATDGWFVLGVGSEEITAADAYAALDAGPHADPTGWHHNDLEAAACSLAPEWRSSRAAGRPSSAPRPTRRTRATLPRACATRSWT